MPRGSSRRGRGGNFKSSSSSATSHRSERESALDRLGKVIYPKGGQGVNDKFTRKYKFVRNQTVSSCIVTLPAETRIKLLTKRFLKAYYDIFDQPGRTNLHSQYSADAFFSFSSTYPMPTLGRNLLEVRDSEQRLSMLIHDRSNIAAALATFSPTEHLVNYLTVDVPYYMANPMSVSCLQLVVTGVFKDTSQAQNPLRAFTRIFVLKHTSTDKGEGEPIYQIFNDIFMLQVPTPDQIKKYHSDSQAMKKLTSYQQPNSSSNTSTGGGGAGASSRDRKECMIESIMAKTRMNRRGSTQLLEDCNWNEEKSIEVFNKLYPDNKIPQDFFTQ